MVTTTHARAESDLDLFAPREMPDPYPALAALREQSAAVYMTRHDFWVLTRYDDVRAATADWESFTSAQGVSLTPVVNEALVGSVLGTDPPEHDQLRAVLSEKLAPRALSAVRAGIDAYAGELVDGVVARGTFDAFTDVARLFPIEVVSDLVGLPKEGREVLQPGADAMFAGFGPFTPYLQEHFMEMQAYQQLMVTMTDREKLTPGGWGEAVMDAVDDGRLTELGALKTLSAYMTAGMDTTVNAITSMLKIFAEQPQAWDALRADPSLAAGAFEEVLRLETPVQGFFRVTTREVVVGDATIPEGARVMLHWGAANRDPAHYPEPDRFDVRRNPLDHLAFGYGTHGCAGQGLARMEMVSLLKAFVDRVERFQPAGPAVLSGNPAVRGLESVPLSVTPAVRS